MLSPFQSIRLGMRIQNVLSHIDKNNREDLVILATYHQRADEQGNLLFPKIADFFR